MPAVTRRAWFDYPPHEPRYKQKRPVRAEGDIAYIPLTRGYEAVIDAQDVCLVGAYNWCAVVTKRRDGSVAMVYATRTEGPRQNQKSVLLHRVICPTQPGTVVDHIDGDSLNNRRSNLRTATMAQNTHNSRAHYDGTHRVKGVYQEQEYGRWQARIKSNGKRLHLGSFGTMQEAADAYAIASAQLHGEFGRLK